MINDWGILYCAIKPEIIRDLLRSSLDKPLAAFQGLFEEHRDSHRPHTAGHWRDGSCDFLHLAECDITHQPITCFWQTNKQTNQVSMPTRSCKHYP